MFLNADQAPYFHSCPRCGTGGLEKLSTHAHCVNCFYWPGEEQDYEQVPRWALDALKSLNQTSSSKPNEDSDEAA